MTNNKPYPHNRWGPIRTGYHLPVYRQLIENNIKEIEVLQYNIHRHMQRIQELNHACYLQHGVQAINMDEINEVFSQMSIS